MMPHEPHQGISNASHRIGVRVSPIIGDLESVPNLRSGLVIPWKFASYYLASALDIPHAVFKARIFCHGADVRYEIAIRRLGESICSIISEFAGRRIV
jgi:hypothetical protein